MMERARKNRTALNTEILNVYGCWGPEHIQAICPSVGATDHVSPSNYKEWVREHALELESNVSGEGARSQNMRTAISQLAKNIPWDAFALGLASEMGKDWFSRNRSTRTALLKSSHLTKLVNKVIRLLSANGGGQFETNGKKGWNTGAGGVETRARLQSRSWLKPILEAEYQELQSQWNQLGWNATFDPRQL